MEKFEKRIREAGSGKQHYAGFSTQTNIDRWSKRASANSLHPGETPSEKQSSDAEDKVIVEAKKDKNHEGGTHMTKVRRGPS